MVIFDYIYFRVAKYFFRKDGTSAPRAIAIVTVVQVLLIGAILFTLEKHLLRVGVSKEIAKYIGTLIAGVLLLLNYLRYKGKYFRYREKWLENEKTKDYRLKGYLVVMGIILPFLLLLLMTNNPFFNKLF
jgi:uncharacterized membrane protein